MYLLNDQTTTQISAGCTDGSCSETTLAFIENCTLGAIHQFTQVFQEVVSDIKTLETDIPAVKTALISALQAIHIIK